MADAMLDARQEGGSYRRIELITGERRRRRWTAEEKARIVAESLEDGANISEVARRNGVVRGLLTVWRHKFATAAGLEAPGFVPVRITSESGPATADEPDRRASAHEVPPLQMSPLKQEALPPEDISVMQFEKVANEIVEAVNGRMRAMSEDEMRERASYSLKAYLEKYG